VHPLRAGNGTRTRDPNLGKVVLYQLSYSRGTVRILAPDPPRRNDPNFAGSGSAEGGSGGEGDRTPDLVNAIHALSHLSYAPGMSSCPALERHRGKQGNVCPAPMSVNEAHWPAPAANRADEG
jgi:hypothetical protein